MSLRHSFTLVYSCKGFLLFTSLCAMAGDEGRDASNSSFRQSRCSEAPGLKLGAPQPHIWSVSRDSDLSTTEAATEVMALHRPGPTRSELERPRGHPSHLEPHLQYHLPNVTQQKQTLE